MGKFILRAGPKVQERLEDVDEVQVERECPEHGELLLRFGDNNSWRNNDLLDRVLGYIDFRKSILRGEAAEFTCLVGTMVQENQTPRSAMPAMPAP